MNTKPTPPPSPLGSGTCSVSSELPNDSPKTLNELHLFAGGGGGILGGLLLGHHPCCAVEIKPYCRQQLLQRQRDGILPWFPIWDDVTTFDGKPWNGIVDIICGGFPCQDISGAGTTNGNKGIEGERSGLWGEMARIIREVGPRYVFVENSPILTSRGLGVVLGDLAAMGYDARWGVVSAAAVGAPHIRERIWILADAGRFAGPVRCSGGHGSGDVLPQGDGGATPLGGKDRKLAALAPGVHQRVAADWWRTQRGVDRSTHGMAHRMERLHAAGNGQVPSVVATAWRLLSRLNDSSAGTAD
ncbi:MAG: DNA cytosine methyltransferase [Xanthomonadales bacterium]|nr:DNA cytosine methyltransferase [Xanthomonadales bacterium]